MLAASGSYKSFQMGSNPGSTLQAKDRGTKLGTVPKCDNLGRELQKSFLWTSFPIPPPCFQHFHLVSLVLNHFTLPEQTVPSPNWHFAVLYRSFRAVLGGFRDAVGWRWCFHRPIAGW